MRKPAILTSTSMRITFSQSVVLSVHTGHSLQVLKAEVITASYLTESRELEMRRLLQTL